MGMWETWDIYEKITGLIVIAIFLWISTYFNLGLLGIILWTLTFLFVICAVMFRNYSTTMGYGRFNWVLVIVTTIMFFSNLLLCFFAPELKSINGIALNVIIDAIALFMIH